MTERNQHRHRATCRERATFTTCGHVPHEHTDTLCRDKHGNLRCGRPRDLHQHVADCRPWLYRCGYPE